MEVMGILNKLKSFIGSFKTLPIEGSIIQFLKASAGDWSGKTYTELSKQGYETCSVVFACIDRICKCIRPIDILVYDFRNPKEPLEAESHLLNKLIEKPNPSTTWQSFINTISSQLLIGGNVYILKIEVNRSIKELWTLRPDCVRLNDQGFYEYTTTSGVATYSKEQILHIKTFHPRSDVDGLAPTEVAGISIDENMEGKRWTNAVMKNSGVPSGVLKTKETLDTITFKSLEEKLQEKTIGSRKGRPLILEGGLDWQQVSVSPKDMEWMNSRKFSTVEICSIYGMPPEIVGYPEFRTYNNVAEAKTELYIQTVLPLLEYILDELNYNVVNRYYPGYKLTYDRDTIDALRVNIDQLWDRVIKGKNAGLLSMNEARLILGYSAVTYGNVIYDTMGRVPIATDDDKPIKTYDDALILDELLSRSTNREDDTGEE